IIIKPQVIPYMPMNPPNVIIISLYKVIPSAKEGTVNSAIAVVAIIITIGALTKPASTAACPNTKAPTILTAEPTVLGNLTPDSLIRSNIIVINKASTITGNDTPSLAPAIVINSTVDTIS